MAGAETDYDPAWNQVGRFSGFFAGISLFVVVALTFAEARGLLGAAPQYRSTAAGAAQDEFAYWIAVFAHMRQVDWDIFLRDSLQALANLAIFALGLAVLNLVGARRALAQLALTAIGVGALFNILDAMAWITLAQYWRGDWSSAQPEIMLAVGRDTQAIMALTHEYTEAANVALAIGIFCLGLLAAPGGRLPWRLRYLAYVGALLVVLGLVADELNLDNISLVLTLLSVVVFPSLLIWLGLHFQTLGRRVGSVAV